MTCMPGGTMPFQIMSDGQSATGACLARLHRLDLLVSTGGVRANRLSSFPKYALCRA